MICHLSKISSLPYSFVLMLSLTTATTNAKKNPSLQDVYDGMDIEMDPSDYTIHDPSRIITVGKKQMIAVTGKAQEDGYNCGIETWWRKIGDKGKWQPGQCLFQTKPIWVKKETPRNDGAFWAPELDLKDGKLTMLYSVTDMTEDDPNTCLGIALSSTDLVGFPNELSWEDSGEPLNCIIGKDYDVERSTIDPSTFWGIGKDENKLYIVTGGGFIIGSELNPKTYKQLEGEWFDVDKDDWRELARGPKVNKNEYDWVEAAFIHPNPNTNYYYLFVNWGACCSGVDSTYEIRVGRSRNPMGPFKDKKGNDMMKGGGTLLEKSKGYVIGPGHLGIWKDKKGKEFISAHYYDKRRGGNSWILEKRLKWKKGWPKLSKKPLNTFPKNLLDS